MNGTNGPSQAVTWKATFGTITAAGFYSAPSSGTTDTVTATSVQNTAIAGSTTVTLTSWMGIKQLGVPGQTTQAYSVATDTSGNVYVAGYTSGGLDGNPVTGVNDCFVSKYDSSGVRRYTRQLGVPGQMTRAFSVATDTNGNVYAAGFTNGGLDGNTLTGTEDFFVTKYDNSGVKQYTRQLGVPGKVTAAESVATDTSGNVYVAGYTNGGLDGNTVAGSWDFFVTKYDSSGAKQYTRQLGVPGKVTQGYSAATDTSGNVYVAGYTQGGLDGNTLTGSIDFFVTKYDSGGVRQYTHQLGVPGMVTEAKSVATDASGNVYVAGYTDGGLDGNTVTGFWDFFVTQYDSSGMKQYTRQLGVPGQTTHAYSVATDSNSNVYVAGYTDGGLDGNTVAGIYDFFVTKYDSSGAKQYTNQLGVPGKTTQAYSVATDTSGNVYVAGYTDGGLGGNTLAGTEDFFLAKYNGSQGSPFPAPTITSFAAGQNLLAAGDSTTLTGVFSNGTGSVNSGVGAVTSGTAVTVSPGATTTYTLTVTSPDGVVVTATTTVTVVQVPVITSFSANPASVWTDGSSTLTAVFSNGTASVDHQIGSVTSGAGASTGALAATTTYTLTVTNALGTAATASTTVTVTVPPPPSITSFAAGQSLLTAGDSTTLTGVFGDGTGFVDSSVGPLTSGTPVTVSPTATTTYTLTVTNPVGAAVTATATVTVVPAPVLTSFMADPAAVAYGGSSTLIAVFSNGTGSVDNQIGAVTSGAGAATGTLTASTSFTLTVANAAGTSLMATATVTVTGSGVFTATAAMVSARYGHAAALLPNGKVLLAGGQDATGAILSSAEVYDPAAGTYTATAGSMVTARMLHTATLLPDGLVLLAGGQDEVGDHPLASAELYDPAADTFTAAPGGMATPRILPTATLLANGLVLIAGGDNGSGGGPIGTAELFDPASGTFTTTGAMVTAREIHSATLLPSGQVLLAGGFNAGDSASAELYDPVTGTFTATGSLATGRYAHTATLLPNGLVLVAAGSVATGVTTSAELYDPAAGTFSATGDLDTARNFATATLLPDGQVFIAAGYDAVSTPLTSTELYDLASGTFTATANSLATGREGHTATLLPNDKVLLAGGMGSNGTGAAFRSRRGLLTLGDLGGVNGPLASGELYDPQDLMPTAFSATGYMSHARIYHTMTPLGSGKFLVAGGDDSFMNSITNAELYDPASGFFAATGPITANFRINSMSMWLPNGKVLLAGGDYGSNTAELYNPASGTFTAAGNLAETRGRGDATATLLPNGKVLLVGGETQSGQVGTAELYNPVTGTFTKTGSMQTCRSLHTANLLRNGLVLVAGGTSNCAGNEVQTIDTSVCELYNPTAGTFSKTGKMSTNRQCHTATLLPNGKVLITGGESINTGLVPLATAEIYDPFTGTFTATGSMTVARASHTATLLPNGKVMIAGGTGPVGQKQGVYNQLASTEIYDPSSGAFTAAGKMGFARARHTAALLWNGKVLVVGGAPANMGNGNEALATAEISQ